MDFSLFFFGTGGAANSREKYRLLIESAKYADEHGFHAIWTPERHFHEFGGIFPNPALTSAALASITKNLQIRTGSQVLPLHDPLVVAENWSVIDNISNGRAGISVASGWQVDDFVLAPQNYRDRKEIMVEGLKTISQLWAGESIRRINGNGNVVEVTLFPRPVQSSLPIWITAANSPETFTLAGELGTNLLTHLLGQDITELKRKIILYREALEEHGHKSGRVTLMLHTFVSTSTSEVRERVRGPFIEYLRSSVGLMNRLAQDLGSDLSSINNLEQLLSHAFERYFETSGLFGSLQDCLQTIHTLGAIGVDEVACLIDFGVEVDMVLASLPYLSRLKALSTDKSAHESLFTISNNIRKHKVTHMQCTPSLAQMIMYDEEAYESLGSLKTLLIGGEQLNPSVVEGLRKHLSGSIFNMYGPTETTIWSTAYSIGTGNQVLIGRPIANTKTYVLDEDLNPVPIGIIGELYIGGEGVSRGYLQDDPLTKQKFLENFFLSDKDERMYRTGDLVRYLEDGNLEYIGRVDDQVKIRGHRVEIVEIESVLSAYPEIGEAVVIAKRDRGSEPTLIAYIAKRDSAFIDSIDIKNFLRKHLPDYMVPSQYTFLDALPRTPNGKYDRRALATLEIENIEKATTYIVPRTSNEKLLAEIWQRILGVERVGIHDNYFDLGGNSILAIRINSEAKNAGLNFTLRQLFAYHTIAELAQVANTADEVEAEQDIVVGSVPLTPIQKWFFEFKEQNFNQYSQSFSIQAFRSLDETLVKSVIKKLVEHHDALRLQFVIEGGSWQQFQSTDIDKPNFSVFDLSGYSLSEQEAQYKLLMSDLQKNLDLENGLNLHVGLFKYGNNASDKLSFVIHHLVIDGVSWRILLEDFVSGYAQALAGLPIKFPKKTTSYKRWAEKLTEYAKSQELIADTQYWLTHKLKSFSSLPVDIDGQNTASSVRLVTESLNRTLTTKLINISRFSKNLSTRDVLVAALSLTIRDWIQDDSILLHIEGHGREPLFDDVDISRTVGWFTSLYPVSLQLNTNASLRDEIESIVSQLSNIPHNGMPYGVLKYLTGSHETRNTPLLWQTDPQVLFNFHGPLDYDLPQSLGKISPVVERMYRERSGLRTHLIEIESYIKDSELQTFWVYSPNIHREETIKMQVKQFSVYLSRILSIVDPNVKTTNSQN